MNKRSIRLASAWVHRLIKFQVITLTADLKAHKSVTVSVTQKSKAKNLDKIAVQSFSSDSEMGLLGPCEHTLKVHQPHLRALTTGGQNVLQRPQFQFLQFFSLKKPFLEKYQETEIVPYKISHQIVPNKDHVVPVLELNFPDFSFSNFSCVGSRLWENDTRQQLFLIKFPVK